MVIISMVQIAYNVIQSVLNVNLLVNVQLAFRMDTLAFHVTVIVRSVTTVDVQNVMMVIMQMANLVLLVTLIVSHAQI